MPLQSIPKPVSVVAKTIARQNHCSPKSLFAKIIVRQNSLYFFGLGWRELPDGQTIFKDLALDGQRASTTKAG